jgi:hypothetical protein
MHRHLAASLPALDAMLRANSSMAPLLGQLQALLRATAAAAAGLFAEYAESVARDGNKVLPMDGTVHPLTAQVLSYLKVGVGPGVEVLPAWCSASGLFAGPVTLLVNCIMIVCTV